MNRSKGINMFEGKENKITEEHLRNGEVCAVTDYDNSISIDNI